MSKQKSLKQKAVSGIIWSAFQRYSTMIVTFISGIILARLLTPHDYGCIGMLAIFMVLAESFIDGGFGEALIQKKNPTQADYSTIFFWNIAMAVLMYFILYFSAPSIASFYDIPLLCDVLRVQGIVLFVYAFNIVQRNQLRKKMNFKVLSIVTIITSITSLTITILMAYNGYGVWSLVAQNIISGLIPALVFWFYIKWRPQMTFSLKSLKELFSFGFYMFLTYILNRFERQIQGLLIGKVYDSATMGYYSKAHSVERLSSTSISQVMSQVTFPLYAEMQDDKGKLSNALKRLTMTLSYFTFPMMFILILCAKPIFILLYSDRWTDSIPYFQVLCLAGMAYCLQSVNNQTIAAIGKSKVMFIVTVIKRIVGISFIVFGLMLFGMKGLLVGVVLNTWVSYFININVVSRYIGYKWWKQLVDIMPVLVVSALAAVISYSVGKIIDTNMYVDGLIKLTIFVVVYCGWSVTFKPESFVFAKENILSTIKKLKH